MQLDYAAFDAWKAAYHAILNNPRARAQAGRMPDLKTAVAIDVFLNARMLPGIGGGGSIRRDVPAAIPARVNAIDDPRPVAVKFDEAIALVEKVLGHGMVDAPNDAPQASEAAE